MADHLKLIETVKLNVNKYQNQMEQIDANFARKLTNLDQN